MSEITFLESDQDFEHLIPLVKVFSEKAEVPYWQQLNEVTASFTNPSVFVIVGKDEGKIIGYLCGILISQREFMITQILSSIQEVTQMMINFIEVEMKKRKVEKIFGLSKPHPRMAEKYGFKLERYVISKDLTKEE